MDATPLREAFMVAGISMARLIAMFSVLPFLGGEILPGYIKNSILATLILMVYPIVSAAAPDQPLTVATLLLITVKEMVIGLFMGFVVGLIFWSAQAAGVLIDNQRGATMSSIMDPLYGESTSPMGSLLLQAATAIFFVSGGFLLLLEGVFESYRAWPVFQFFPDMGGGTFIFFLQQVDALMRSALLMAAPVLIALFLAELCLGLVSRFAPQLNVFSLSMSVKSGVACVILVIYLSLVLRLFSDNFENLDNLVVFFKGVLP